MPHLSLEIFDIATKENPNPTESKYAMLPPDTTITITDTSEIFASGDVWSHSFTLNVHANAHIFGTAGDIHGGRLHEQINRRRARLWVEGLPLYLGYLKLDEEAEVDREGNIDVGFESGQKTFEDMIDGVSAREVSVGDVPIGVALNRRRVLTSKPFGCQYTLDGLSAFTVKYPDLAPIVSHTWENDMTAEVTLTQYAQRYPKLVISHGDVWNDHDEKEEIDYTNVQSPYDAAHPFCNINICYQMKANKNGEEVAARAYTLRLAHGKKTTHGGDEQTRYNNAPNFYLLYFIDRLFKDLGISIQENEALNVEDIRRVFLLNYGCFYEEIEDSYGDDGSTNPRHKTPSDLLGRYKQYYMSFIDQDGEYYLAAPNTQLSGAWDPDSGNRVNCGGKVLLRDVEIDINGQHILSLGSVEGKTSWIYEQSDYGGRKTYSPELMRYSEEQLNKAYSAYLAYATGENYPNVNISDIIEAMKKMFGIRLLFSNDFSSVRIILLRNVFRSTDVQEIKCEIVGSDIKQENVKRGFRMTYGKGQEDTTFYYKGFADLLPRKSKTWRDTTDRHDYSQWDLHALYDEIKQYISAFNKTCYVTPATGNAFGIKVDEDEDVLFPSLFEYAGFMDAEDGDCSMSEEEGETVEEVNVAASPVIMNDLGSTFASLFNGDMKAPTPLEGYNAGNWTEVATFARLSPNSVGVVKEGTIDNVSYRITGKLDLYACERFGIRLEDNYSISNGGTPFDSADPGLCFGIMRSSGSDATVRYADDPQDDENDTWDILPGSNAISHPDSCDNYGNEWDYADSRRYSPEDASGVFGEEFSDSNASFADVRSNGVDIFDIKNSNGKVHHAMMVTPFPESPALHRRRFMAYVDYLSGHSDEEIMLLDAGGYMDYQNTIVELDSSFERCDTCRELIRLALGLTDTLTIDGNGVASDFGRLSLKLRAEKLNPFYDQTLPNQITTKEQAAKAVRRFYTTSSSDLLSRPRVTMADMRRAGWQVEGDGDATYFSVQMQIVTHDGKSRNILWTAIEEDGTIITPSVFSQYINSFGTVSADSVRTNDTLHLILDMDTTEERAYTLHQLQAIYYAQPGEQTTAADISPLNTRYLEIDNPKLRGRGLCDALYKEYSFWVRNARVCKRTVKMEIAQLLTLDKTKKVRVGDIVGFIRKIQYSVESRTGLGEVTMEIMYI